MSNSLNKIPYATVLIATLTLLYSMYVAFKLNGNFLSDVKIFQLEQYGGITFLHLKNLELWRLFTFQLIHVKYMHMFYNVLSLIVLGVFIERHIGAIGFFLLWFFSGCVGTLIGTLFEVPPWNLGTGASQAVLGVAGFGLVLSFKGINLSKWCWVALAVAVIPAFALDFIHAGYPKPGHIVSLFIGLIAGFIYSRPTKNLMDGVS